MEIHFGLLRLVIIDSEIIVQKETHPCQYGISYQFLTLKLEASHKKTPLSEKIFHWCFL